MKKFSAFAFFLLFVQSILTAQSFSVSGVDASAWPKINVSLSIPAKEKPQQGDFLIREASADVPFTFELSESGSGPLNICFLIEASGHTYGTPVEQFKKATATALSKAPDGGSFNVCYFGRANADGKSLNVISAEFTTDRDILKNEMNNRVKAARDTNRYADVFKSIYECLDFMNSKNEGGNSILIVLSAAINNSSSPIRAEDCIEKSQQYKIPVYTVTYKTGNRYAADNFIRISDKTGAKSSSAKSESDISSALSTFMNHASENSSGEDHLCILSFTATQKSDSNRFDVIYKGESVSAAYSPPVPEKSFLGKYWWLILIVVIAVAGIIIVTLLMSASAKKRKAAENEKIRAAKEENIRLQEQLRKAATDDKTRIQQPESKKIDLKKTMIGGSTGIPTVKVVAGNFSKEYPLNKNRISVGRAQGNDIVIPDQTVSSGHAEFTNEAGIWYITDKNSTNGTFVNAVRINRQKLSSGDIIKMGSASLRINF
jgi:type II secretory pathway pseudopilin PulG